MLILSLKSFDGVLRKFNGCLKFKWYFKEVERMFQASFEVVLKVSKVFQECFKGAPWALEHCSSYTMPKGMLRPQYQSRA